jgi:hypothetical protein
VLAGRYRLTHRVWLSLLSLAGAAIACNRSGSTQPAASGSASPGPPPASSTQRATAQPTTIVARNATGAELTLDVSFGPATIFQVTDERGRTGGLVLDDPKAHCPCVCVPGARCPECEPPRLETLRLAADRDHRFSWSGNVLVPRDHRPAGDDVDPDCRDRLAPAPGRYLFQACNQQRTACGITSVDLPRSDPIVIQIDPDLPPPSCPLEAATLERAARMALRALSASPRTSSLLAACDPSSAVCAPKLEPSPQGAGCSFMVVPSGRDLIVHVTPGPGTRVLAVVDANAVQVRKIEGRL